MAKLANISGKDAVKAFQKAGWTAIGQVGSHVVMIKSGVRANLSIPQHRELSLGTLRALIRNAGDDGTFGTAREEIPAVGAFRSGRPVAGRGRGVRSVSRVPSSPVCHGEPSSSAAAPTSAGADPTTGFVSADDEPLPHVAESEGENPAGGGDRSPKYDEA